MTRIAPVALSFLLVICGALPARAAGPTELSISGTGSVTLPPDLATVDATVETNAPNITEAISDNNARYDRVVAALTRAGIARNDVTLSSYNVNYVPKPKITPPNSEERYGYTVTRGFNVKVRRIAMAGQVIDACTAAGATGINGVGFAIANPAPARDRAIAMAVDDARDTATKLATAAGLRIVGIKSLDLGGGPIVPQGIMMAKALPAAMPTQFDQSNVTVTVNVNVVFLAAP
ncbi:MAG TPA: SIMPL domain-containing protein [Candidatus Baltobacteraceae bacterium]|jgi:hypothetical protein|nr:SIMPL domain-containing protein [Candidatus Baltobacteraceae bacterium]